MGIKKSLKSLGFHDRFKYKREKFTLITKPSWTQSKPSTSYTHITRVQFSCMSLAWTFSNQRRDVPCNSLSKNYARPLFSFKNVTELWKYESIILAKAVTAGSQILLSDPNKTFSSMTFRLQTSLVIKVFLPYQIV